MEAEGKNRLKENYNQEILFEKKYMFNKIKNRKSSINDVRMTSQAYN